MFVFSFWTDLAILFSIIYVLISIWARKRFQYWTKKEIPGPQPSFFVGNMGEMLTLKKHMGIIYSDIYNKYKNSPYCGVFMMFRPTLVVNDLEMIKEVLVKDFPSFSDHLVSFNPKYEPLSEHLFNAGGEKWKTMRQKLTPTFTTNKMKFMFETVKSCTQNLQEYLEDELLENKPLNAKEVLAYFGMNVIGSCAFGVECNTFKDKNSPFIKHSNTLFNMNNVQAVFQLAVVFCFPEIARNIPFSLMGKEINDFFHDLVKDTIDYRKENNITRNDFLQVLMHLQEHGFVDESEKNSQSDDGTRLTTMQLAAQVFVFFIAGFETSSTTASFALYELALNPDIQDNLREDIKSVLEKHDGKITYDSIGQMTYLTKVIEETLRKYPPLPVMFRMCTKEYKIPNTDITIDKDTPVMIPVYGIQRDPQYFPNPDKFDPERFSPENKATRNTFTYLPFGEGPRICIGSRFGMMQTRLGLVSVLLKYKVSVCEKTLIPMDYDKRNFILSSKTGIWLKFTKIED